MRSVGWVMLAAMLTAMLPIGACNDDGTCPCHNTGGSALGGGSSGDSGVAGDTGIGGINASGGTAGGPGTGGAAGNSGVPLCDPGVRSGDPCTDADADCFNDQGDLCLCTPSGTRSCGND